MTSRQLEDLLADAAAGAPVTGVTAAGVYRRGRRRRTLLRSATAGGVAVVLAIAGFGLTRVGAEPRAEYPAEPREVLDPLPAMPGDCTAFAEALRTVAEATLPTDYEFTGIRVNPESICDGGGLIAATFVHDGTDYELGFEGGTQAAGGEPCDAERAVTKCVQDGASTIGQYTAPDDYGVLLGREGIFFFLGVRRTDMAPGDPPLTPDQLTEVARQIVRVIYRE